MKALLFSLAIFAFIAIFGADAFAQNAPINVNVDDELLSSRRLFQLIVITTVLSLAPSILMMVTSFTRIIVVFSFLRTALGLQTTPPNTVLISLALFLTLFVMGPTLEKSYTEGVVPYLDEQTTEEQAMRATIAPFRSFMGSQVVEKDLDLFLNMLPEDEQKEEPYASVQEIPLKALIPAFMISELRRAFEIGFMIFIPFLVIDLAIASILMSMGMMMLPPVIISLPFKVIFFVLIDGWALISGSLVQSFNVTTP